MFLFHAAYALGFIALALGISLIVWSSRNKGKGVKLAKTFGYIISILVIFSTICASYYAISYWAKGYYSKPPVMISLMQNGTVKSDNGDQKSDKLMRT